MQATAQEEGGMVYLKGQKYLDVNIRAREKLNKRVAKQQEKLLKKLKRKEEKYLAKLKRKDSVSYVRYQQQPLTYDSIAKLNRKDSAGTLNKYTKRGRSGIDSLKGVKKFLQDKAHLQGSSHQNELTAYDNKLSQLKAQEDKQTAINQLIQQRTTNLKNANKGSNIKVGGLTDIQKLVFYAKGKMGAFEQISNEPSKGEEKALEFLQGQEGFDSYLKGGNGMASLTGKSSTELDNIGIQTKQQIEGQLKERFGGNLSGIGQTMSGQIKDFDKHTKGITDVKNKIKHAKQAKQSFNKAGNIQKPEFKTNPMRSLPFSKRIEKQFNYQTTRPTIDGMPAILQISAMAGFRHTASLTYGLALTTGIGLGQNWSTVKFSFEGIGFRTYAEWKWQYGFGAYAGYERMYKRAAFTGSETASETTITNKHNNSTYNESLMLGITKTYRINEDWNGGVQLLYDVWWKEKNLRSPIQLRFVTGKNN
ncbi:hypothetical protein [Pedobacter sp. UBA4863]|uniref:hypothetical protein n=1 Tax=Pedobacter sp. UBA4863 TaxID=1947060 RepID=UPI0025CEF3B7|nr:hypothetical protein [Pedobacter sp. UBA4863]